MFEVVGYRENMFISFLQAMLTESCQTATASHAFYILASSVAHSHFFSDTLVGRLTIDFYDVPDSGVTIFANGCFIGVCGVYHSYHSCRTSLGPPGPD